MIDPVLAVPFFIGFTIVGYIVIFKVFIRAPFRGIAHVLTAINPKLKPEDKLDSKEVIATAGRGVSSYLIFCLSVIIGLSIIFLVGTLEIQVLTIFTSVGVAVGLFLIYTWAQNRI